MKAAIPQRVYLGWQKYWDAEPWGAWRDNMHAAIIAREVRRTIPGAKLPEISVWLLRDPLERAHEASSQVLLALGTVATRMTPKEASKKLRLDMKARSKKRHKR